MTLGLTTPDTQPPPGITRNRFSPIRFRSPLLTESQLFSLPAGTEMFHFPAFPPNRLYIQRPVTHHNSMRGFPIRTSWHQRSVINSTRLIADSHVLHRLLLPRHPPCALKHLHTHASHQTQIHTKANTLSAKIKMLASTMQFPNNNPQPQPPPETPQTGPPTMSQDQQAHRTVVPRTRSEEHTSELQSRGHLVCRLL